MFLMSIKKADARTVKYKGQALFFYTLQSKTDLKPLFKCLNNRLARMAVSFLPRGYREYAFFGLLYLKKRFLPSPPAAAAFESNSTNSGSFKKNYRLDENKRPISILIIGVGGGIGDMLILLAWVKEFYKQAKFDMRLDAYNRCFSPHLVEHLDFINHVYGAEDKSFSKSGYDLILKTTPHFIYPIFANDEALARPEVSEFCDLLLKFTQKHNKYYSTLPRHDGSWSRYCSLMGWNRWDEYGASEAIVFSRSSRGIYPLDEAAHEILERSGLKPGSYITIHAGFDATYEIDKSTKVWPLNNWLELVNSFKEKYPDFSVVQIGAENSLNIDGVDCNLLGKTSFREAAVILKHSFLHIDGESGLVHLRHILGGRSVVLFGPTPVDYFSYSENTNLVSELCHDCMWLTDDWFVNCPKGLAPNNCMAHISSERVMGVVSEYMDEMLSRKHSSPTIINQVFFSSELASGFIAASGNIADTCGLKRSLPDGRLGDDAGLLILHPKDRLEYGYMLNWIPLASVDGMQIAIMTEGRGALIGYLAAKNSQITIFGLNFKEKDDSSPLLERKFFSFAAKNGFEVELASYLNLPCEDGKFNLVYCSLELGQSSIYFILSEALRILRSGGRLILTYYVDCNLLAETSGDRLDIQVDSFCRAVRSILKSANAQNDSYIFNPDELKEHLKILRSDENHNQFAPMAVGGLVVDMLPKA